MSNRAALNDAKEEVIRLELEVKTDDLSKKKPSKVHADIMYENPVNGHVEHVEFDTVAQAAHFFGSLLQKINAIPQPRSPGAPRNNLPPQERTGPTY